MPRRSIATTVVTLAAGALLFSACSKDASEVSQSKLESKLRGDSDVTKVTDAIPGITATKKGALITCIASTLRKDADGDDLQDYVDGDSSLDDISGADSDSDTKAKSDVESCVKTALGTG